MNISLVQIFVKVVQTGSFTKAAENLRMPKSTVSKAVSQLESETATKLLVRTTRSQTLTAAGKAFYDTCVGPIQTIEDAQKSISGKDSLIVGTLRITAPEDLGTEVLAPLAGQLIQRHPGLCFELIYTDEVIDLVRDGYDLAVRIGKPKESALKIKKVGEVTLVLVASPSYLKAHPKIQKPQDLESHTCLSLDKRTVPGWTLQSKSSTAKVAVQPSVTSNQMSSLLRASMTGAGVALVPAFLCRRSVESGELTRVLPQWSATGFPVSLLSPLPFSSSARLRVVSDQIVSELQRALAIT